MSAVDALQRTLAGEHAAVYVLGVCAAQTSQSEEPGSWQRLSEARTEHAASRDRLVERIRRLGGSPVAAEAAYVLPTPCRNASQVLRAARIVEQRVADTAAALVAETVTQDRRAAIELLTRASVRLLWFRGIPETLPGTHSS